MVALWADIAILFNFGNGIVIGAYLKDFREEQVENGAKTGKCSIFQGFQGGFSHLSLMVVTPLNYKLTKAN